MQVLIKTPPPVGKQYLIFLISGVVTFVVGAILIAFDGGSTTSGSMAVSDGCCAGCLIILLSLVLIAIGLSKNTRPVELLYVQE